MFSNIIFIYYDGLELEAFILRLNLKLRFVTTDLEWISFIINKTKNMIKSKFFGYKSELLMRTVI